MRQRSVLRSGIWNFPDQGTGGNIEYLLYLHKPEQASEETVTGEEALAKAEKSVRFHRNRLLRKLTGVKTKHEKFLSDCKPRKAARRGGGRFDLQLFAEQGCRCIRPDRHDGLRRDAEVAAAYHIPIAGRCRRIQIV